ncbi:hypothetical protein [Rathayibacter sp. VKM Ac-2754]|uniref:hypothetical protein n=1 Tax=Rathayibacter sp. VKM Ac-2754 TaxID=2609251 RepID=UPI001359C6E7|nr:hypothetical protein [Rathayibacter sp. VKM Ac-2754]MWV58213.1 hypothetical protein [Rathayibacter sp. VKM Ac-2754]
MPWPFKRKPPLPKYMQRQPRQAPTWLKSGLTLALGAILAIAAGGVQSYISGDLESDRNREEFVREQRVLAYSDFRAALQQQDSLVRQLLQKASRSSAYSLNDYETDLVQLQEASDNLDSTAAQIGMIGSDETSQATNSAVFAHAISFDSVRDVLLDATTESPRIKDRTFFSDVTYALACYSESSATFNAHARADLTGEDYQGSWSVTDCPEIYLADVSSD